MRNSKIGRPKGYRINKARLDDACKRIDMSADVMWTIYGLDIFMDIIESVPNKEWSNDKEFKKNANYIRKTLLDKSLWKMDKFSPNQFLLNNDELGEYDKGNISRILSGTDPIQEELLNALCKKLGVEKEYLIGEKVDTVDDKIARRLTLWQKEQNVEDSISLGETRFKEFTKNRSINREKNEDNSCAANETNSKPNSMMRYRVKNGNIEFSFIYKGKKKSCDDILALTNEIEKVIKKFEEA